ncbi:MAG: hypothetical protein ACRELX_06475 [Longimicrobiales bacterium]
MVELFAVAAPVRAQQRGGTEAPQELPREFVDLLLGRSMYSPGIPTYLVGGMPGSLPGGAAFEGEGRVVGSVLWRDRNATAIAVAMGVEDARERFEALAQEAGWTPRPAAPPRFGFVPARSEDPNRGFCWPADGAHLSIRAYRAGIGDGSYILLEHSPARGGRLCAGPPDPERDFGGLREFMPTLRPPDGLQIFANSRSGAGDYATADARLFGEIAPAALVEHFETQLREQGWTVGERLAGETAGVLSAQKPHDDGATLKLTVLMRRLSEEEQSVAMRIVRRR